MAALKLKMEDPALISEAREKYSNIAEKAINMTESIKHSIVLLQVKFLCFNSEILTIDFVDPKSNFSLFSTIFHKGNFLKHTPFSKNVNFLVKLAHVLVITTCRYSVAHMCT